MKLAFDFDGTLSEDWIQKLAETHIKMGHDVWVVTSRNEGFFEDVHVICDKIGLDKKKIIFTNGKFKWEAILKQKFDVLFDNLWTEVELVRRNGGNAMLVSFSAHEFANDISNNEIETFLKPVW